MVIARRRKRFWRLSRLSRELVGSAGLKAFFGAVFFMGLKPYASTQRRRQILFGETTGKNNDSGNNDSGNNDSGNNDSGNSNWGVLHFVQDDASR